MKRLLILASAAIVALTSCSKTQVVYNDTPEEIGFKAVSGVMTKADDGTTMPETMGVFANYTPSYEGYTLPTGTEAYKQYIDNMGFKNKGDYWGAAGDALYWPLSGELDFVVYAPYDAIASRSYSATENTLTIKVDNTAIGSQTNWLYGENMLGKQKKTNNAMPVALRHALAKITVSVTSDLADLEVVSLVVNNTKQDEILTVDYAASDDDYSNGDSRLSWTNPSIDGTYDMTLIANHTAEADVAKSGYCYVIPYSQTSITLTYILPGATNELTYEHTLTGKWIENHHYTYNISIGVNEIKFNPSVDDWATPTPAPGTIEL